MTFHFLRRYFAPNRAYNIAFDRVTDGCWCVTFYHNGRRYRGHVTSPGTLLPYPWYSGARGVMKQPVSAVDDAKEDVLDRIREYWGPTGGWNQAVGLNYTPGMDAAVVGNVTVNFNDGSTTVM